MDQTSNATLGCLTVRCWSLARFVVVTDFSERAGSVIVSTLMLFDRVFAFDEDCVFEPRARLTQILKVVFYSGWNHKNSSMEVLYVRLL